MTYADLTMAVRWMSDRWGANRVERLWDHWEAFASDFTPYTAGALKETLHRIFRSGAKFPPGPSEVLKELGVVQAQRIHRGDDEMLRTCAGDHVWAEPHPSDEDRHQVCALCGEPGGLVVCAHSVRNSRGDCAYCPDTVPAA